MSGIQSIKKQLGVVLKGIPIIAICLILSLLFAAKIILYTNTTYQSIAKVKLDDSKYGFSSTTMYENFDIFSSENYIETEAELLNSPLLIGMALDSLDFDVSIYRTGSIKNTLLYENSPISIEYNFVDENLYQEQFHIEINNDSIVLEVGEKETAIYYYSVLGKPFSINKNNITVFKKELKNKKIVTNGKYQLKFYNKESLIKNINSRLDVKAVSKEISILRVVYTDESSIRAAKFTNRLCKVYVEDYIRNKAAAANTF